MANVTLSLLVFIIGLLMYALAANPKVQRIGEIMCFCGLLAALFQSGPVVTAITR